MPDAAQVLVVDSCVGGLSVLKSLWQSGQAAEAMFFADYAVNPLGEKDEAAIARVVENWMTLAGESAETLVMACNTLSIRYHRLRQSGAVLPDLQNVVSMVDCFSEMIDAEADKLADKNVLIVGTRYTAAQSLYGDLLQAAFDSIRITTVAATDLERQVARLESFADDRRSTITAEIRDAMEAADTAILACTCFPIAAAQIKALFPHIELLDPGRYCSELLPEPDANPVQKLRLKVSGKVVSEAQVAEFARDYLLTQPAVATSSFGSL